MLHYNISLVEIKSGRPVPAFPERHQRDGESLGPPGAGQKVEVAALARLGDVIHVEPRVAARRLGRWRPARAPAPEFRLVHQQVDTASGRVEPDAVAILH